MVADAGPAALAVLVFDALHQVGAAPGAVDLLTGVVQRDLGGRHIHGVDVGKINVMRTPAGTGVIEAIGERLVNCNFSY